MYVNNVGFYLCLSLVSPPVELLKTYLTLQVVYQLSTETRHVCVFCLSPNDWTKYASSKQTASHHATQVYYQNLKRRKENNISAKHRTSNSYLSEPQSRDVRKLPGCILQYMSHMLATSSGGKWDCSAHAPHLIIIT